MKTSSFLYPFLALGQPYLVQAASAIVGGSPASLGEFPHQASLRYGGKHICGASIISPTKILTAAHCVEGINVNYFQVATGTIDVNGGQLHKVTRIVIHPGYTGQQKDAWRNDVAVITLAAPIEYNQYQNPIALATVFPSAGTRVALSGWGRTSVDGDLSDKLQKMGQEVVGYNECQKRHAGMPLDNSHLCAFGGKGVGFCLGDTGGPLIANGMQVGIASWVLPCAQGVPDVYANVAYLRNFILSQM